MIGQWYDTKTGPDHGFAATSEVFAPPWEGAGMSLRRLGAH